MDTNNFFYYCIRAPRHLLGSRKKVFAFKGCPWIFRRNLKYEGEGFKTQQENEAAEIKPSINLCFGGGRLKMGLEVW